jgi:hypothetical protein
LFRSDKARKKKYLAYKRTGRGDKAEPVKRGRLFGMLAGAAQGMIVALVFLTPVAALANTAAVLTDTLDIQSVKIVAAADESPLKSMGKMITDNEEMIYGIPDVYKKSVPGAIYGALGLDGMLYKPLTTVRVSDTEKVSLEDFSVLAATIGNLGFKYYALDAQVTEETAAEEFIALYEDYLTYANGALNVLFDNGLISTAINEMAGSVDVSKLGESLKSEGMATSLKSMSERIQSANTANTLKKEMQGVLGLMKAANNEKVLYNMMKPGAAKFGVGSIEYFTDNFIDSLTAYIALEDTILIDELFAGGVNYLTDGANKDHEGEENYVKSEYVDAKTIDWAADTEHLNTALKKIAHGIGSFNDESGHFEFSLDGLAENEERQDGLESVAAGVDSMLEMSLMSKSKVGIFNKYVNPLLADAGDGAGIALGDLKLYNLQWEALTNTMVVVSRITGTAPEGKEAEYGFNAGNVVDIIDSLRGQYNQNGANEAEKDPSGIVKAVNDMLVKQIKDLNVTGLNEDYFNTGTNSDLGIMAEESTAPDAPKISNAVAIGALIELSDKQSDIDNISKASGTGKNQDDRDAASASLDIITGYVTTLDVNAIKGTGFRNAADKLAASLLPKSENSSTSEEAGIKSLVTACKTMKMMLKVSSTASGDGAPDAPSEMTDEEIKAVIQEDLMNDPAALDYIEDSLGDEKIDIQGDPTSDDDSDAKTAKEAIEAQWSEINGDDSKYNTMEKAVENAKLERIAGLFGWTINGQGKVEVPSGSTPSE